jgi:hypothetical protein
LNAESKQASALLPNKLDAQHLAVAPDYFAGLPLYFRRVALVKLTALSGDQTRSQHTQREFSQIFVFAHRK